MSEEIRNNPGIFKVIKNPGVFKFVRLRPDSKPPWRAHASDAGWDVSACIKEPIRLAPGGERAAVPTGVAIDIPEGWEIQIRPRSGLALRNGISIVNAPATIDAGYRDELHIILVNTDPQYVFTVEPGMRIAQLVPKEVPSVWFTEVTTEEFANLPVTARGTAGFGSTGTGASS